VVRLSGKDVEIADWFEALSEIQEPEYRPLAKFRNKQFQMAGKGQKQKQK